MRSNVQTLALVILFAASDAAPCTNFMASRNGITLVGSNADFVDPDAHIWFVPASPGKHGRAYFGYALGFPMGGVNDQGLFFECPATAPHDSSATGAHEVYAGSLMEKALEESATVGEALKLFDSYDHQFIRAFQILFVDRFGDSAIIEGDTVVRKQGDYQIATNFRQSLHEPNPYSIDRYTKAENMLKSGGEVSVELFRSILAATHQEPGDEQGSPTQVSKICNLGTGDIQLFHYHDYVHAVQINLADELRKGPHHYEIRALFPQTTVAFDTYRKSTRFLPPAAVSANPAVLPDLVGEYVADPPVRFLGFTISSEAGKLFGRIRGFASYELIPESDATYYFRELKSHYSFVRGSDGKVNALVFDLYGLEKTSARKVR